MPRVGKRAEVSTPGPPGLLIPRGRATRYAIPTTAQDDGIFEVVEDVASEVGARDEPGARKGVIYRDPASAATRTVVSRGGRTSAQSRSPLFTNASIRAASACG